MYIRDMTDIRSRIIFDDSDAIKSMDTHIATINRIIDSYETLDDESRKALESAAGDFDKINQTVKQYERQIADAGKETKDTGKSVTELTGDIKFLGVNLSQGIRDLKEYASNLRGVATNLKTVTTSTTGVARALRVLKVALVSTGIGAIIVALGTLATFLTKVQAGMDLLNQATTALGAAFDVLTGRIGKLFEGDFEGAFRNLGDEIVETATRAATLAKELQEINRALVDQRVTTSESRKQIAEFKKIYEDTTQSFTDRIDAARKAGEIEQRNIDNTVDLLRQRLERETELAEVGGLTDQERQEIAELQIELNESILESTEKQIEIQNTLNGLIREQIERERERLDFVRELRRELEDLSNVDILASESENEIQARIDRARDGLRDLLTDYQRQFEDFQTEIARRRADGLFVDDALVDETTAQFERILDDTRQALDNLAGREPVEIPVTVGGLDNDGVETPDFAIEPDDVIPDTTQQRIESTKTLVDALRESFELLATASQAFGQIAGEVFDFVLAGIQQQLDAELAILDAIRERTDVVETELEREIALRDEGRANAVESKRRELTELRLLESESEERARDIRRRQLNAQLLADSASQLSNLATAATGFFSANANIPIVGIGFAVAAISTMFSILAGIRARSKALQESFSEGGFIGRPGTSWSSDRYGRGHRVENSNVVLGGDEYVINGRTTQLQRAFLDDLNSGMYNNVDIGSVLQGFQRRDGIANRRQGRRNAELVRESMMMAVGAHTSRLIDYMKHQKHVIAVRPGDKIITFDDRGDKHTTTFRG